MKRQVIETESDSLGLFGVELPSTGTYRIQVTSLGYTTLHSGDIHVPARPPDFELRLVPEALAIEPITVTAEGRSDRLARIGFYQRQATGHADGQEELRIGRVLVAEGHRGRGLAERLMKAALEVVDGRPCRLDAQSYLVDWYRRLGFEPSGEEFLEDGIPHVPMRQSSRSLA